MSVDQDVLSLYVSVNDISFMKINQSFSNHKEKLLSLSFWQSMLSLGKQIVIERVSSSILENKVKLGLSLNHICEFCDGCM